MSLHINIFTAYAIIKMMKGTWKNTVSSSPNQYTNYFRDRVKVPEDLIFLVLRSTVMIQRN